MTKIAIFVDVQNIYYTTRDRFSKQFNYRQFWRDISQQGDIVIANAYAIARSNDDQQHKFQKALKHIGFNVKLKPFIQRSDGSAKGDFDMLMDKVRNKFCVETHVYGVHQLTAQSLINSVDNFTEINEEFLL
ncbi:NYN domain-containing protein [Thalassotalea profundi]|nr:NYN domain-containing protein [Thalassotalea profundi]